MRVVVVGAGGQLGAALLHEFRQAHEVIAFDRAALDITSQDAVDAAIAGARPDVILNAAAYNAVDGAEAHPVDALRVNAFGVRALARAARARHATLVHYSSDFVFDGEAHTPYVEADRQSPRSVYAASKLLGEWFAADAPKAYVLRVESLFGQAPGGPAPRGSLATIVDHLRAGRTTRVFEDRTVSPTYVMDAARATRGLIEQEAAPGLYHCVNTGYATWTTVAREAARLLGVEPRLERVSARDVKLPASRPRYCALSNAKLVAAGVEMPTWQDALARALRGVGHQPADEATDRQAGRQPR